MSSSVWAALLVATAVAVVSSAAPPPSPSCQGTGLQVKKDLCIPRPVSYKNIPGSNLAECCSLCAADEQCVALTMRGDICHLKNDVAESTEHDPDCVSVTGYHPSPKPTPAPTNAKNILFIVADDMRPSLGSYEQAEAVTPNMDKLAKQGMLFRHAYVQFAYCAPSRNSFMSGRRPDATHDYNFLNHFRQPGVGDKWVSLPQHFKDNGYLVTGGGKLFHEGLPPAFDQPKSWSPTGPDGTPWPYKDGGGVNATNTCAEKCCGSNDTAHYCLYDLKPDTYLADDANFNVLIARFKEAVTNWHTTGQPFFVGMGFHKPHLPWNYPRKFYEQVPEEVATAKHQAWPADVPHLGFHDCAEMSHPYWDTNGFGVPPGTGDYFSGHQAEMRRVYYGCIAYVDDMIGQLLDVLDNMGATNDTAVMVTGDHGWHLGEHNMWCKMSTLELGTRVPLIFRAPWVITEPGAKTDALAELVDLFPTLSDLAGLSIPSAHPGYEYLGGTSLVPVLKDSTATVKTVALSQFPRCWQNNTHHPKGDKVGDENNHTNSWESMSDCHWTERDGLDFMGYRMRTKEFAITQWVVWDPVTLRPVWNKTVGLELYSHTGDNGMSPAAFDNFENENLANKPQYRTLQEQLLGQLHTEVAKWFTPNPPPSVN